MAKDWKDKAHPTFFAASLFFYDYFISGSLLVDSGKKWSEFIEGIWGILEWVSSCSYEKEQFLGHLINDEYLNYINNISLVSRKLKPLVGVIDLIIITIKSTIDGHDTFDLILQQQHLFLANILAGLDNMYV